MFRPAASSISILGVIAALGCSSAAWAGIEDPCVADPVCRAHEDRGIGHSAEKDYASALVEFQAAYARAPIPRLLINIGRSLFRLGQPQEALKYYQRFSRADSQSDPEILEKVRQYTAEAHVAIASSSTLGTQNPSTVVAPAAEARQSPLGARPTRSFPIGATTLIGLGIVGLSIGLGLGGYARGLSSQVVSGAGPFDNGLYAQGMTLNQTAIALDAIGGMSLAAGGIWLGVWLGRRKHTPLGQVASLQYQWTVGWN